ncbi:phosphatidylinositol/phosphatidylcholine transfer protein SFH9-like isoform X2 [Mangifera indica]|uniref:phosphatidylinositol/phosphatidylcholine transfer protein SFH9-like isoform X2 n=1 Tax=Mangifera indica TaxID=29780 RepID=UPI001CF94B23|nr:phosphatidylinositol/phosphatidylcholine transfer protein SFH9-like isoform X2 [Mangifera indica]
MAHEEAMKQLQSLIEDVADESMKEAFKNMHQGNPTATLERFLKARDWNVSKAHKMLIDCLKWRVTNDIDNILSRPIVPAELYRAVRDSQLMGLSGYSKEGLPVIAVGVGQSTYDKASPAASKKYKRHISTCLKVLDMTGLKLSALNQIKLMTAISTVDDLNYPEKTETYYIVNVPYMFSACWKVVKPLLQERTKRKIQVLQGNGRDELLKIMDYDSLPHFCRNEGSGSSQNGTIQNCFSLDHPFHQMLYNYTKQQAVLMESVSPIIRHGSVHVDVPEPDPEDAKIAETIESEFHRLGKNGLMKTLSGPKVDG